MSEVKHCGAAGSRFGGGTSTPSWLNATAPSTFCSQASRYHMQRTTWMWKYCTSTDRLSYQEKAADGRIVARSAFAELVEEPWLLPREGIFV